MPLHPKPHQLLSHWNPRWYQLIQVFLENRPLLNECSSRSPCCNHSTCHCCCNAGLSLPDYPASVANTMGHKQAVMWPAWHHHHGNFTNIQHTHTHTFNGPLSGTTQVSRYQKGKTNLDFTDAGDSEWQWHQLGHMQTICTSLHASTPTLSFLQAGCASCHPTNSINALKAHNKLTYNCCNIYKHTKSEKLIWRQAK